MYKFALVSLALLSACSTYQQKVNYIDDKETPVVSIEGCPDWSKTTGGLDLSNVNSSNYGCATVNNMGQQVADPKDLIIGKSSDGADSSRTSAAVTGYKSGGSASSSSTSSSSSSSSE